MDKPHRFAQLYGYAVCFVAVVTFLFSLAGLVRAIIDLGDPLHAGFHNEPRSLASFETYKLDVLRSPRPPTEGAVSYTPDAQTIRAMYEAERSNKIQAARHNARQRLIVDLILVLVAGILFGIHWIWLRRIRTAQGQET